MLAILGIALGGLGILLVLGIAAVVSGCHCVGCEDEEVTDAGPQDAGAPPPDPFAKPETHSNVEPDSYKAVEYLWTKEKMEDAKLDNWHRKARMYIGTADQLYQTVASNPTVASDAKIYTGAVKGFFEDHYKETADKTEDGMLVLMGGLAPEKLEENAIYGAFKAMGVKITDLGEGGPEQKSTETEYIELLKAVYHFNKAVEKADKRFSKPNGRTLKPEEKKDAKKELEKAEKILKRFEEMKEKGKINEALTDDQQELLDFLSGALADYKKTLGGGGHYVAPKKQQPKPQKTRPAVIPGAQD